MKGEEIKAMKRQRLIWGILWIVAGVLVAFLEAIVPVFELKGIFSAFVALPFLWIGITKCYRSGKIRPADILRLSRELHSQITPEWVVETFDVEASEAMYLLKRMEHDQLIRRSPESLETGELIYFIALDENPGAAAMERKAAAKSEPEVLSDETTSPAAPGGKPKAPRMPRTSRH
jgi:hypothetical protein